MGKHLIVDGNAVYEIDESCMRKKQEKVQKSTSGLNRKNKEKKTKF